MRTLLAVLISTVTFSSFAANAIDVFQYQKDANGKKIFSRKWNSQTKTGELVFQVVSARKSSVIPDGKYDLSKAKGDNVFQTYSGGECTAKFSGTMEYSATGITSSPIKLVLTGEGCRLFFDNFPYKFVHMPLFGVPTVDGSSQAQGITIHIQTNAFTECGLSGSISERLANCSSMNGSLATRTVSAFTKSSPWSLVSYSEAESSAWRDNVTGLVWGPVSKIPGTLAEAEDACGQDSILKYIPVAAQFSAANEHGVFNIFPKEGAYWAPKDRTTDKEEVTVYLAHRESGDNFFGIVDRSSPLRKSYFHCVNK